MYNIIDEYIKNLNKYSRFILLTGYLSLLLYLSIAIVICILEQTDTYHFVMFYECIQKITEIAILVFTVSVGFAFAADMRHNKIS